MKPERGKGSAGARARSRSDRARMMWLRVAGSSAEWIGCSPATRSEICSAPDYSYKYFAHVCRFTGPTTLWLFCCELLRQALQTHMASQVGVRCALLPVEGAFLLAAIRTSG